MEGLLREIVSDLRNSDLIHWLVGYKAADIIELYYKRLKEAGLDTSTQRQDSEIESLP